MTGLLMLVPGFASAVILATLMITGDLTRSEAFYRLVWFSLAAYLQFKSNSLLLVVVGLIVQVVLAITLKLRLDQS